MTRGIALLWAAALAITTVAVFFVLRDVLDNVYQYDAEGWWCVVGVPLAGAIWFLRQSALPDRDRDISWRIRNAVGCAALAAGATNIFIGYVPDLVGRQVDMMWGIQTGFSVGLPALGLAVVTLVWGLVDWVRSGQARL